MATPVTAPSWPRAARCAIALNNLGCALLERNCVVRAHATFYDALRVLAQRPAATGGDAPDDEPGGGTSPSAGASQSPQGRFMSDSLRHAELRLISSSSASSSGGGPYRPIRYNAAAPGLGSVLSEVRRSYCHSLSIDVAGAREEGMISEEVLSAIVLINYANAGLGKALLQGRTSHDGRPGACEGTRHVRAATEAAVDRALKIVHLAHAIVEACDARSESTLFLELLVLDTRVRALWEAERAREANELGTRLDALCHDVEATFWFLHDPAPAARAA